MIIRLTSHIGIKNKHFVHLTSLNHGVKEKGCGMKYVTCVDIIFVSVTFEFESK